MPDTLGSLIADSDIKILVCILSMLGWLPRPLQGKLTNKKEHRHGQVRDGYFDGFELYDWMDDNPMIAAYRSYVNDPRSSQIEYDLDQQLYFDRSLWTGQRGGFGCGQIKRDRRQLDFLEGASASPGGKSFICLPSTYTDKR